jgi:ketosteroid isomerase-like protein
MGVPLGSSRAWSRPDGRVLGSPAVPALLLLAALLAAGCATATGAAAGGPDRPDASGDRAPLDPAVRLRSAEDAVRAADEAMSRATQARDPAAFLAFVAPDAVWGGARGLSSGKPAVLEQWRPFLEPGGASLTWSPHVASVASSGDLAYTVGGFALEGKDRDGRPATSRGEYATVWRRDPSGAWLARFDIGNRPAAEVAPGAARARVASAVSGAGDLEAEVGTWTAAGETGPRRGAWMVVRVRDAGGWRVAVDTAVPFRP